jgi:hypothetical protein
MSWVHSVQAATGTKHLAPCTTTPLAASFLLPPPHHHHHPRPSATGVRVSTDAMFDIQIKRIHEYKRQLLNVLGIIYRYDPVGGGVGGGERGSV